MSAYLYLSTCLPTYCFDHMSSQQIKSKTIMSVHTGNVQGGRDSAGTDSVQEIRWRSIWITGGKRL